MNTPFFLFDPWDSETALPGLELFESELPEFLDLSDQEEGDVFDFDIEAFWPSIEGNSITPQQPSDFTKIASDREPLVESIQSVPPLQSIPSPKPPQSHILSQIWQPIPSPKPPEFDLGIDLLEHSQSTPPVPNPSQTIASSKPSPLQVAWTLTSALATDIWNLLNVPISLPIGRIKLRQLASVSSNTERVINAPKSASAESLQTTLIRQGDVLIVPLTDKISHWLNHPINLAFWKDTNFQKRPNLVLAEGEVTGHKHRISNGKAELYERDGVLYLRVLSPTALLTHEEHNAVTIPRGSWAIRLQREYEPHTQSWIFVAD